MSVMYSPVLKYSDVEHRLMKNQEMDSSIGNPQQYCHQPNSGLQRYCSAPSSLLASLIDNNIHDCFNEESFTSEIHQHYPPSTSSEMDTMLSKLLPSNNGWSNSEALQEFGSKPVKQEIGESVPQGPPQQNEYSYGGSQLIYQSQQIQGLPNGGSSSAFGSAFGSSFGVVNSMASEKPIQPKLGARNCSHLFRQKSFPAGFFSIQNGSAPWTEIGTFKAEDSSNGLVTASTGGLHSSHTFSSRPFSCSKRLPQIAENGNESLQENCDPRRNLVNDKGGSKCYIPSFTHELWESFSFNAPKTENEDGIMFSTSNILEFWGAILGQNQVLTPPQTPPLFFFKMSSIRGFFQIQGFFPLKKRPKRGFPTHPRSIAERVRGTKIWERIKKLHPLFPK
uniref:Uncharacterized protein n=1 Tax=Phaseolus vulgaris TaxID=3885 RepID=T2DN19_PHAVU|nr:hypothetical protein [Phaseolus vulgaris]